MDPKTGEVANYDVHGKPVTGLQPPAEKPDPKKSPTFLAREELARRREAERQEEMADQNSRPFDILEDDGTITPGKAINEEPEIPAPAEAAPQEPPADAPPVVAAKEGEASPEQAQEPEETMRLIVDGKEMLVPKSKVLDAGVRTFQKETAADLRLAAAAELERQARQRFQVPQPQQAEFVPAPQHEPQADDAALAHDIQFGTEEQAKAAIAKLRGGMNKIPTPQEIRGFVQRNIMETVPEVLRFQDANNWVRNEYKEIFADPLLEQQFMLSENARRANGDARPHRELYKELAETMVSRFRLRDTQPATQENPATPQPGADRLVRKANSPRPVQAAGGQKSAPAPARNPTVTDFVEKQRQLRGLAPLPRSNQSI